MDLRLHFRVLARYKYLVIGGFIAAVVLMFFSYFKVDFQNGKVGYRETETWQSSSILLLTQSKSPLYSTNPLSVAAASTQGWLTSLPGLYAQLANSDVIGKPIRADKSLVGKYQVSQVLDPNTKAGLPFLEIDALSTSQGGAVQLASTVTTRFLDYLQTKQVEQAIPDSQRVVVQTVTPPTMQLAKVIAPRKKTIPIVVFFAVMVASIGLAYILENLRSAPIEVRGIAPVERPHVSRLGGPSASEAAQRRV